MINTGEKKEGFNEEVAGTDEEVKLGSSKIFEHFEKISESISKKAHFPYADDFREEVIEEVSSSETNDVVSEITTESTDAVAATVEKIESCEQKFKGNFQFFNMSDLINTVFLNTDIALSEKKSKALSFFEDLIEGDAFSDVEEDFNILINCIYEEITFDSEGKIKGKSIDLQIFEQYLQDEQAQIEKAFFKSNYEEYDKFYGRICQAGDIENPGVFFSCFLRDLISDERVSVVAKLRKIAKEGENLLREKSVEESLKIFYFCPLTSIDKHKEYIVKKQPDYDLKGENNPLVLTQFDLSTSNSDRLGEREKETVTSSSNQHDEVESVESKDVKRIDLKRN